MPFLTRFVSFSFPPSLPFAASDRARAYLYDLFTVVVHEGSMNTGHYTNYSRCRNSWYRFDDDKVQPTTENQVLQARAYQLCYRRRLLKNITSAASRSNGTT